MDVGLVGMHIAHKTRDHVQWIWSTFEQVDNLRANSLPEGGQTKPSFYDPSCPPTQCPVNCPPAAGKNSQFTRDPAIAPDTAQLNTNVQQVLRTKNSTLQYYELVGTQYIPTNSKGPPTPAVLRNTVIEPYMTGVSCTVIPQGHPSSCLGCHQTATIPAPGCPTPNGNCSSADFSFLLDDAPVGNSH